MMFHVIATIDLVDGSGVMRMVIGVERENETMVVYSPGLNGVTLFRTESRATFPSTKINRIYLTLHKWWMLSKLLPDIASLFELMETTPDK